MSVLEEMRETATMHRRGWWCAMGARRPPETPSTGDRRGGL